MHDRNVVAVVERRPHFDLLFDDRFRSASQVRDQEVGGEAMLAEQDVVVDLGHLKDGVPQRLAGDRATMRAIAADRRFPFDDCDRSAILDRLHRGPFATGAGADDNDVVFTRKFGHGDSPGKVLEARDAVSPLSRIEQALEYDTVNDIATVPTRGTLLGLDYGTKRFGVAVSTPDQSIANTPRCSATSKSK